MDEDMMLGGGLDPDTTEPNAKAVTKHLDRALEAARETEMNTSELLGLFFYYAHSIAESFRQNAIAATDQGETLE